MQQADKVDLWWDNYNSCFQIIIVTFLFLCGCILRSLCCAIITDGCMLGPTKRNPNLIVFWKGSDHHNPKNMLHLVLNNMHCESSLKKALLVWYPQLAVVLWAVLHLFIRFKGFEFATLYQEKNSFLLYLPLRPGCSSLCSGTECQYRWE